ncbi:MAG: GNAT family N-acetyltransferase [Acidobacteriota bacterium]
MRTPALPHLPAEDELPERLILKDGSVATLRPATTADEEAMRRFFHDLSANHRYQRFLSASEPTIDLLIRLCDSSDQARALTLVAVRTVDGQPEFIGVGSYIRLTGDTAEVAFAVRDELHGKGIATALLERLGVTAVRHGFRRFRAMTLEDNFAMRDVFQQSGFDVTEAADAGTVDVDLTIAPTDRSVAAAEIRERLATAASIAPLLEPRSVAVVGASRNPHGIGRRVLDAIVASGFRGPVVPINRDATEISGRSAYSSVQLAPGPIDLAVLAVPRAAVLDAVDDCAAAGVKALVVITAGFAERDDDGRALQRQLVDKVRGYGMRMVGPNCMGVLNAHEDHPLNASFSPVFPPGGGLALLSQSGALGIVILSLAATRQVGLSSFVSVGNKADVSGNDLLQYWENDSATRVIALYLESFGNPRRFARLARRIGRSKPIIAVKAGRTRAGSRAAGSHTAALAASDTAVEALFRQTGVIRADTIDEMFDIAACLEAQPLPRGRRVAIVTNAGGPGILAADACDAAGLTVVEFSAETKRRLAEILPAESGGGNPVDMIASAGPDAYRKVLELVMLADEVDAVMVLHTPVETATTAGILEAIQAAIVAGRAARPAEKPVVACLMAETTRAGLQAGTERVPVYAFPENAARALGKVASYAEWRTGPRPQYWTFDDASPDSARALCKAVVAARGSDWLTTDEMRRVLQAFGIQLIPTVLVRSAADAASTAAVMGFPVVAKISSPQLVHKSDVGGVRARLDTAEAVSTAFDELAAIARERAVTFDGVILQPQVPAGVETMIGVVTDRLFGPLVGFGLGGTEVEVLGDVRFRVCPLSDRDIDALVRETRAYRLLLGHRGRPLADLAAVNDLLSRVSCLAEQVPEIQELDLNPVIVLAAGRGVRIVDARIKVGPA